MPFTIFDPNMNKIDYPVGVTPLDFLVSAIEKERYVENIKGIPGPIDYGFDYKDREVTLNFWLRHFHGEHDQKLLKSELYAMLDSQPYFYVSDDRLPTRVLKLAVDEPYLPDRINGSNISTLEFKCQIIGLPFWKTKYSTQEIQKIGYNAIVEKFGLGDGIHQDFLNYDFDSTDFTLWNGGNTTIDPRYMISKITVENLTSDINFAIINLSTSSEFVFNEPLVNQTLTLDGSKILVGANNRLRDSNREYIKLKPGENHIRIRNGSFSKIKFDFPFYYK
ncbi:phage tail domain-containing protein [Staphylococcus haemolyticus]|uniref:Siphovirus-type tail component RIFT-related domain-containing protein n=1 Tax=Staphylococcus haemolyticus (strain JCSC1435) TaxID=279808 RepID=Q4L5L1_STAHJ|nr:phage tail domain-containing protein [Staphylococcus haemolyticus]BAE05064.1 unnamed protein product [Staphylococcus haemolyticus JCSC1435]